MFSVPSPMRLPSTSPYYQLVGGDGEQLCKGELIRARTLTGICVRADTPMPDISTPDGFKQTLLKARSVAYTNPQAGGTSGIFLVGLLERLGIAEAVGKKALLCINGNEIVDKVSAGDAESGFPGSTEDAPFVTTS